MNIFDDEVFYQSYSQMDRSQGGLEASGEWSTLEPLMPDVGGWSVLDLGCGYGWHSGYFLRQGAGKITAIDSSIRMLEVARHKFSDPRVTFSHCDILSFEYQRDTYDLVFSNLALHYIADLETVYKKVHSSLRHGGLFLFNIEHPVFTAGIRQEFKADSDGLFWPVQGYFRPGERHMNFLGHDVVKQHHTLSQILEPLICLGFFLEAVREVWPDKGFLDSHPDLCCELERPMMLIVKAVKN